MLETYVQQGIIVPKVTAPEQDIFSFEAPYLEEKLLAEGKFNDSQEYDTHFTEFKKFADLARDHRGLAMTSKKVDDVWHQFILFTQEYMDFCDEFVGRYLHHSPNTSHTPETPGGVEKFVNAYTSRFGRPDRRIWNLEGWCDSGGCGNMCGDGCGNDCASD